MKENKISELPKPFIEDQGPYRQKDFKRCVKKACTSYLPFTTCLKMCKVIVLGDLSVGKTSLINRYCYQAFNMNYKATIGVDFEVEDFNILNMPFSVQIWDTAGQERFKCIAASYYRSAHAIVTVFDLTSKSTLYHCPAWLGDAMETNSSDVLKFLIGTKRDLLSDNMYSTIEEEALKIAKLMGAEYWAVSSKTGAGVTAMFQRIAALCFEQTVIADMDEVGASKVNLGQSLYLHEDQLKYKKKAKCDGVLQRCAN